MLYDFSALKRAVADSSAWLAKELRGIRTNRATPALLDGVLIEAYGTRMPVSQLSSVAAEDARTLRVSPWDPAHVKAIEKAILTAELGVSVAADEKGVRVSFPELTAERREALLKIVREKLEQARVALRAERDKVWHDIQARERRGELPEDDKFRSKEEMEKIVADGGAALEAIAKRKEAEIRG